LHGLFFVLGRVSGGLEFGPDLLRNPIPGRGLTFRSRPVTIWTMVLKEASGEDIGIHLAARDYRVTTQAVLLPGWNWTQIAQIGQIYRSFRVIMHTNL
jgi:hypothetical protein